KRSYFVLLFIPTAECFEIRYKRTKIAEHGINKYRRELNRKIKISRRVNFCLGKELLTGDIVHFIEEKNAKKFPRFANLLRKGLLALLNIISDDLSSEIG
ncbi:unnamed protein product, partial [Larinioides sclopetarius]